MKEAASTPEAMLGADPEPADIAARLARVRRTGDPDALWPGVSRSRRVRAGQAVARVTRDGLAGQPATLAEDDLPALSIAAFIAGLGPLLGCWMAEGRVTAPEPTRALFARHLADNRARNDRLDREAVRLIDAFRVLGIEPVLLKGAHIAQSYPDPGARPQSDVDLLLPAHRHPEVDQHLRGLGWRADPDFIGGRRVTWHSPDAPALPRRLDRNGPNDPWSLDLHWTLDRSHHSGVVRGGNAETVARAAMICAGREVSVLGSPDLPFFAVMHASLSFDDLQLNRLVDLVLLSRRYPLFWTEAATRAGQDDSLTALYPAAALTERVAPGTVPAALLSALQSLVTPRMRRVVREADPGTQPHRDARSLRQKLMWARGPVEILTTLGRSAMTPGLATWRRRLLLLTRRPPLNRKR